MKKWNFNLHFICTEKKERGNERKREREWECGADGRR